MARRSFFSDLRFIEGAIHRQTVSDRGEAVFEALVEFVEECGFSQSKAYRFICKNWRLDYGGLEKVWVSEGYKAKNQATFRVQVSCLSAMLYSLFPKFSRELFVTDLGKEVLEEGYMEIESTVSVIGQSAGFPQELFVSEVLDYPDNLCYGGDLKAEDCLDTAAKLKPLLKAEVFGYLDGLDINKIKYIISVLQKPLSAARSVGCNTEKVALLKALGVSDARLEQGAQDGVVVREVKVEVPEKTPYNLCFSRKMADILTECASARMTIDETKEFQRMPRAEHDRRKQNLAKILYLFTEDGLRSHLSNYSPIDISEVLDGSYPVREGEAAYKFRK